MDENSVSTTALVLLAVIPVVAGAVLTALFTWLAQRRIDRRDHDRWMRERRYEAYQTFLAATMRMQLLVSLLPSSRDKDNLIFDAMAAMSNAEAVASEEVYEAISKVGMGMPSKDEEDAIKSDRELADAMLSAFRPALDNARTAIRAELTGQARATDRARG